MDKTLFSRTLLLPILIALLLSCEAKKETPSQASIEQLYLMATFFSEALNASIKDSKAALPMFCNVQPEQITLYSMAIKSRIDDWAQSRPFNTYPDINLCADHCMCSLYLDISETLIPDLKQRMALSEKARTLQKKENSQECLQRLANFCKSPEFKQLQDEVSAN